jgi:ribose transport system substrate-binding protein
VNQEETPGIEIVASQPANWQRELAMSTMENILQGNPDIDLVWGVNDGMALGALKAITDAGLQDKIKVLGYNGDEEAVESVSKGQMYSTILQQPAEIGRMVITIAEMIRTGKKDDVESVIAIPIVKVTKENAAQYLKK